MSVRTSFEDLAKLGYPKHEIFLLVNAVTGGTLTDESQLHLNDAFTDQYGWYSYNAVLGDAVKEGSVPQNVEDTSVAFEFDNSLSSESTSFEWETRVTIGIRVTLSIKDPAVIELASKIIIWNVAESGYSIEINTESTSEEVVEREINTTRKFTITVGPYQHIKILKTKIEVGEIATYNVPYGLHKTAIIGTEGDKWNGHYHWGFLLNTLLENPGGNIVLIGTSKSTNYVFEVVRVASGSTKSQEVSKVFALDPSTGESLELPVQDEGASLQDVTNAAVGIARPGI
ncbi:hypothetical protein JB92DRAFT_3107723 [Gautieria morchelliformis]|nr:hypothetical protein JB92DRAFT_3107723 [Gautieria morchelliformis]